MGFIKKIWKDRISEFPTRRSLTKTDGTSELVTVARSEGMISEEGDAFSAENMNDFENRVANGFSELNEKTSNEVYGGYTVKNCCTYKNNGIQHVNASISVKATVTASTYFLIGYVPETPKTEFSIPGIVSVGVKVWSTIIKIGTDKRITAFIPAEMTTAVGTSNTFVFYIDGQYLIA